MKEIILTITICATAALIFTACGGPAANNGGTNTANSGTNKSTANNSSAPAGDAAGAEAEIRKILDTTQAALSKNDADAMEKIYSDNYMTVNQDGSVQNRAERLAALRSGAVKYDAFAFSDINIRVNSEGNGAIAIDKLTLKGTFKGRPMDGVYRVTGVYAKTKDGWRLAGSQTTKIEGSAEPDKTDKPVDKQPAANTKK